MFKKFGKYLLILIAVVACLAVAGYFLLRSPRFHRYVLAKIEQKAQESTGARVQIRSFTFHLSTLTVDAYGIIVHGSEGPSARPLLTADHLRVDLNVVSLLQRKIDLREIILRRPVVHVMVAKNGSNNLPHPPRSNGKSTNIFDLGIQHALLTGGEVYYNDVRTPLDAELHDLRFEVKSRLMSNHYDGSLSYREGLVQYGELKALPHTLSVEFYATPSQLELKPLLLHVASSTVELNGNVQDFSKPTISGNYEIVLQPERFRAILRNPDIPSGEVHLSGSLRYQYAAGVPFLRALEMNGRLRSSALRVDSPQLRTIVRNLQGEFQLAGGVLKVPRLGVDLLGGHLRAQTTIRNLDSKQIAKVEAALESLSLDAAKASFTDAKLRTLPLTGRVSGTAEASWTGSLENLKARTDWQLTAALVNASTPDTRVPLRGEAHVSYARTGNVATLTNTVLKTPQSRIDLSGMASPKLSLRVQAQAGDLGELQSLVDALRAPTPSVAGVTPPAPVPVHLGGSASAQFFIRGTMQNPIIRGSLTGQNLTIKNTDWKSLRAEVQASRSGVSIQNGSVVNARQGYVNFALRADLSSWKYLPSNPIQVQVMSRGLALNPLLQLAGRSYPIFGNLSVDISVRGSQLSPLGEGSVRLLQARVYGQPLQDLSIRFRGNGDAVRSSLKARTPAGSATADLLFYPRTKAYDVQFNVPRVLLGQLQPVQQKNLGLRGALSVSGNGRGTLDDPQLAARVQIPQLRIRERNISGISAQLNVSQHVAKITVDSQVVQSFIRSRATINLAGDYYMRASLDTATVPLEGLLALAGSSSMEGIQGQLEVHASAQGPLKNLEDLQAQVVIPTLQARYEELTIANRQPIRVHYANSVVALEPTELAGTGTEIRMQGRLPLKGNAPPTLAAVGTVDAKLARFLQPQAKSFGRVALDVRATRMAGRPSVQGRATIQDVSFLAPDLPVGLEHLNGVIDVRDNQAVITQLSGQAGGGKISASGTIGFKPALEMNVVLNADNVRIRYQDAVRIVASSDLTLQGTSEASTLKGQVTVDSLGFARPDLDLASVASQFQTSNYETPPTEGFASNLKLNIGVRSSQQLSVASRQVDLRGSLNLRVIGTAAQPVLTGRAEFTGGDIFLMNKRYRIQRAIIEFTNASQTEPVLNVEVTTTINQYDLALTFTGPLDRLRTNYVSDPPLPTADVINLIARGQTTEQAQATPSNFGASSLLAEGVASQLSSGIQKLAGFSSFSIDPTLGGNDRNPGARIGFQRRITKNLFLTFATDVTSTQREIIQGEYQFNRRWSMTVTRDENGGVAVDGKFHKRF